MVRNILGRLAAPVGGLHQAAYVLAALTLASQLLALLRDRTFAHLFGAGQTLDLYYAAFRVPDLVFAIVSSLVSAYVLIPRITGAAPRDVRRLLSEASSFLLLAGGGFCILIAVLMPRVLGVIYPDLASSGEAEAFILLARLLLIQPILLGLSGVLASVTQTHRRFVLFALSPVLYNLGIIFGTLVLYPPFGVVGIGAGVILGALAYAAVNVPVVMGAGVFPRLTLPTARIMVPVMRDSVPRSLALGMGSVTALAMTAFASRLGEGAVSVLTLAGNLEAVPLALIGSSYAVAAFPALSAASRAAAHEEFSRILSASSRHIIVWSLVALGLIAVLRAHVVRVIFGTGAFDWDATRLTAALLAILAAGLVAQGLVLLFSRALYAARQSWRPLAYHAASGALTAALALAFLALPEDGLPRVFAGMLRVADVPGARVLLIALAVTAGQITLAFLCLAALARRAPGLARSLMEPLRDGSIAAVLGAAAAYAALAFLGGIAPLTSLASVFLQGLAGGFAGLAVSACTLGLLGHAEFADIVRALGRLAPASRVLAPSADEPRAP
jgi:putative peptidoglycan lipid II flippase